MRNTRVIICSVSLVILVLCMVFAWALRVHLRKEPSPPYWYVMPESEYVRFEDRKKDAAARWLQSEPSRASLMGLLEKSRYSHDKWLAWGRRIRHLEDSLIKLYMDADRGISRESILDALFEVGTAKSVDVLVKSFREDELSDGQKNRIAAIIGKNGDASVVPILMSLIDEIQLDEASPDSDRVLKLNLLSALLPHAPEKTEEYLLSVLKDPGMQPHQKTIKHLLETVESARKVHGAIAAPISEEDSGGQGPLF